MRTWIVVVGGVLFTALAFAKDPPPGSYLQSCSGARVSGEVLSAVCQDRDGNNVATALHYTDCAGEIWNAGGHLVCNKGRATPGGTYTQSCRDFHTDYKNLVAVCEDRDSKWHPTTLRDFPACKGDISNFNGALRCSSEPVPTGSYSQTCRDIWMSPHVLHATCQTRAGDWITSSLDIRGCKDGPSNGGGELLCNRGIAPPKGTYVESCRDTWMDRTTLRSTCKGAGSHDDTWYHTHIADVAACKTPVANIYGCLACDKGDKVPAGTYHTTCCGNTRHGDLLSAACQTRDGNWNRSTFDLAAACRTDVYNLDGFLTCMRGDFDPPGGSYIQTCRDIIAKKGGTLTALCLTKHGSWSKTTLNLGGCYPGAEIWNDDGGLHCVPANALNPPKNNTPPSHNPPPPPPTCQVVARAHVTACTNADGTPSSILTPSCHDGCGANLDEAKANAEAGLGRCLGDGPNCCEVEVDEDFNWCGAD